MELCAVAPENCFTHTAFVQKGACLTREFLCVCVCVCAAAFTYYINV